MLNSFSKVLKLTPIQKPLDLVMKLELYVLVLILCQFYKRD